MPSISSGQSMAVVSPCSTCENFKSGAAGGFSLCPRRHWMDANRRAASGEGSLPQQHLVQSGTDQPDVLANPVYSADYQSVLVWVALLENNRELAFDGEYRTPDILSPGFDTRYIRCEMLPFAPAQSWAQLMAAGVLHEKDQVLVTPVESFQRGFDLEGTDPQAVLTGGFVRKADFLLHTSLTAPRCHRLVSGT